MTLLFRAIWNDDRDDLLVAVRSCFAAWTGSKGYDLELPIEGTVSAEVSNARIEVTGRRAECEGITAVQLELVEDRQATGQRWSTTVRAIVGNDGNQWLWVDLSHVADDFTARRILAAPRLVRDLIATGVDPRVDHVRLTTDAAVMPASSIAGLVRNADRSLPIIVFSHDPAFPASVTLDRAEKTLRSLQGAAQVLVLHPDQERDFRDRLGPELAVWGGAARLYLPNRDARGMRPERHRYVLPGRMGTESTAPARIFAGMLTAVITARRPPASYEVVRRELRGSGSGDQDLILLADQEIDRLRAERDDLLDRLEQSGEEYLEVQVDLLASEEEIARLQSQLKAYWAGGSKPSSAALVVQPVELPATIARALERASAELPNVVVHPDAPKDIQDLDSHVNGQAWASAVWRGLVAVDAYVAAEHDGNFKDWCSQGIGPVWPANDKKLAMRESESVEDNARFRRQRTLPVDPAVNPTGAIVMWAHLKIAEGGGPLAPRVYFHDDTRGPTGKVHVGFVGPHKYMENTRTN